MGNRNRSAARNVSTGFVVIFQKIGNNAGYDNFTVDLFAKRRAGHTGNRDRSEFANASFVNVNETLPAEDPTPVGITGGNDERIDAGFRVASAPFKVGNFKRNVVFLDDDNRKIVQTRRKKVGANRPFAGKGRGLMEKLDLYLFIGVDNVAVRRNPKDFAVVVTQQNTLPTLKLCDARTTAG